MVSIEDETDGVTRRIPLIVNVGGTIYPSLAVEMLRVAGGQRALPYGRTPTG